MAFKFVKNRAGGADVQRMPVPCANSATFLDGDACVFTTGKLTPAAAQDALPVAVVTVPDSTTSTEFLKLPTLDVFGKVFEVSFTPLLNDVAIKSASTTIVSCVMSAGSDHDLEGGLVYIPALDETRVISHNAYSGGDVAITVVEPFTATPTGYIRMVPFGYGTTALKLDATHPHSAISNATADITGGHVSIYDVDMKNKKAHVFFA